MQRIFLLRQIGSSLKFQAKAPEIAEAVPADSADVEANKDNPTTAEVAEQTEEEVGKVARLVKFLKDEIF